MIIEEITREMERHKTLADKALAGMDDAAFFHKPGEEVNPSAIIVKHLAGNLTSRWTDFLTTDGEKSTRDRDGEFRLREEDTRVSLMAAWEKGWQTAIASMQSLSDADLTKKITIRTEPFTVLQALLRGLNHAVYHVGQILYLARLL